MFVLQCAEHLTGWPISMKEEASNNTMRLGDHTEAEALSLKPPTACTKPEEDIPLSSKLGGFLCPMLPPVEVYYPDF